MIRPPRKFEDLRIGETRTSTRRTITQSEMLRFAQQYDPQWFHADPQAAQQSIFGQLIASGVHILAIWRMLDHEMNSDIDFVCGVGFDELRLKTALRPGDTVHATSEILSLTSSTSGKPRGTAITAYALLNQSSAEIVTFRSINLVHCRK